jgi:tetratricopeptide (TPR) repeat protein
MMTLLEILWWWGYWVLHFLLFTFWGWIIILVLVVPWVAGRLRRWQARRRRLQAMASELSNPRNARARFQLGVIHYEARRWRRALALFRQAVEVSEAHGGEVDPKLYQYLGHTLRRLRHHEEARIAYEVGLSEVPESGRGESETGLGVSSQRLGDLEGAIRWYEKAIRANQSLLEPRLRLAAIFQARGRREEARTLLDEARSYRPPPFALRQERRWRVALFCFPLARRLLA